MAQYFISYSRENQTIVEHLRQDLQKAGIDIWIDSVGLQPGTPDWDEALRDAIKASKAVILVASPDSRRSAYVRDEIALAKDAKKPIYPVWVAGEKWMDSIPMGLGSTQNVDLREENYAQNLTSLIGALNGGVTEGAVLPEPSVEAVENPRNPYKGLRAFHEDDSNDFFGRSLLIEDLLNAIEDEKQGARLLAILGASGSGKSSVMMAGILPKVRQNHSDWLFLDPIVPSAKPLEKLTIALARQLPQKSHSAIREDLLDRSTRGLHRLTCELSDKPVVLYIDQFEEVFTLIEKEPERRQFIDLITTAVNEPDGVLIVLLSMRADFYDRPLQYQNFGNLIKTQHIAITPMTLADLYDVVQLPAQLPDVGMSFDEGLVTEMVFAVREEAAALPLLQFTLDQLFQRREGNTLTNSAYQAIGGVQGALAQHAEATFNDLPSEQHKTLARALFLRLIEAGQTEQDTTRRRATYSELTLPDVEQTRILQATADAFVNARLLVTDQSGDKRTIEVSHEALIREWQRLGDWLRDAREDLRLQKSLSADVTEWLRRNKPDDMLYRGSVLEPAKLWLVSNIASSDETHFIEASIALFERLEQEEIERKQREAETARRAQDFERRTRQLRFASIVLGVIFLLATGAGLLAVYTAVEAQQSRDEANTQIAELSNLAPGATLGARYSSWATSNDNILWEEAVSFGIPLTNEMWNPVIGTINEVEMVRVPAGCFFMGSNELRDEQPIHEICIEEDFWIDQYEVTNEQFEALDGVAGAVPDWDDPMQPRTSITWFEARDFCELRGGSLPTEAQWEYAARGGNSLIYPWGNEFVVDYVTYFQNADGQPSLVGSRSNGVSWVGAYDMSGNVWEWISTIYSLSDFPYPYATDDGRENLDAENADRVLRGGSFFYGTDILRSASRYSFNPFNRVDNFGFRCVVSVPVQ